MKFIDSIIKFNSKMKFDSETKLIAIVLFGFLILFNFMNVNFEFKKGFSVAMFLWVFTIMIIKIKNIKK